MSIAAKLLKHFAARDRELLEILKELPDDEPAYEEPPPKPRPQPKGKPGSQEWFKSLPAPDPDRGVDMNDLIRSVPKPKPPRKPSLEI